MTHHRWRYHKNIDKKTLQLFERGHWSNVLSIYGNGHIELHGEIVPPYPDFGSMGGGSQMENRAQREWEEKYGPPGGDQ